MLIRPDDVTIFSEKTHTNEIAAYAADDCAVKQKRNTEKLG